MKQRNRLNIFNNKEKNDMSNLKLVTTENFGNLECNFYRNMNDDILLTREQIGQALEYANPAKAIQKIHLKHKDRLENLCLRMWEVRYPKNGGAGVNVETVYYTQRGIMEICRWSRSSVENKFMDWVWNIVEMYRSNGIADVSLISISNSLNKFTNIMEKYEERLCKVEEQLSSQQEQVKQIPTYKKPYNPWFSKMNPKYKLLEEHFNINRGQLYKDILLELENIYNIDTVQIQADYCYENNVESCYPLEPYEFVPKYREMIEQVVNSNLIKYGIAAESDPIASTKHVTIFDTPMG